MFLARVRKRAPSLGVINTYSKNVDGKYQRFEAREGIIAGLFGIRKVESHFEIMNGGSRRLTTIIFKEGN